MLSWYQISLSATCVFTAFFFLGKILGALIILVAWIAQIFCFGTSYMAASPQVGVYCDTVTSDMTYSNIFIMIKYYTSSTAQGGGGSFKNRKRIGEIDCCE